jgi:adenylate cyclase
MTTTDNTTSAFPSQQILAVLVMDLTDYVRLMEEDQYGTGQRWRRLVTAVRNEILPASGGKLVETRGDSLVLTFAQAQPAVEAAFAIKRCCDDINEGVPAQNHFLLRTAIHVGEVIVDELSVSGHAINLASRLMTSATGPGEIVVTADVHDQLTCELDADFEDLGSYHHWTSWTKIGYPP